MSIIALQRHLAPLIPFLSTDGVTEICINKPQEVCVEKAGKFTYYTVPELSYDFLETLAALIAEYNNKDFPSPLLSGTLPSGERIQFVMNPACEKGTLVCSIRRQQISNLSLDDYAGRGSFERPKTGVKDTVSQTLKELYQQNAILDFIKLAIFSKKNILISGGTGTGKTTFLNACLKWIPNSERIITVEDTREVRVVQPNAAHLLFNADHESINALSLFKACLRLRPDRIFLSELRGAEVWPFLRAANSGHPGTLSTVHADTPEAAFTQLVFMMQQAGCRSTEDQIRQYIKSIIHIVVQLKRDSDAERFMHVCDLYFSEFKVC